MSDDYRVAVHEAGHAVAARAVGATVERVCLTPDGGECHVGPGTTPVQDGVIGLGGVMAVRLICGDEDMGGGGAGDWLQVERLAWQESPADPDGWMMARLEEAERIVRLHRCKIVMTAAELFAGRPARRPATGDRSTLARGLSDVR